LFIPLEGAEAGMEPIGERILEVPENTHQTEFLRNPKSGYIAYVPPGSLRKGEALVKNGVTADGGKVTACTVCHGTDLRGIGQARRLPAVHRAISPGSSMTCSTAIAMETGRCS